MELEQMNINKEWRKEKKVRKERGMDKKVERRNAKKILNFMNLKIFNAAW